MDICNKWWHNFVYWTRRIGKKPCSIHLFILNQTCNLNILLLIFKLPEIVEEFENAKPFKEKIRLTFIQEFGLIVGILIMVFLNMYEESIEL